MSPCEKYYTKTSYNHVGPLLWVTIQLAVAYRRPKKLGKGHQHHCVGRSKARKWRHRGSTDFLLAPPHYLFHTSKSICCGFENLHFPLDTFGIRVLRYSERGERCKDARSSSHIPGFITSYCCRYVDSLWESSKRPQSQIEAKGYLSKRESNYVNTESLSRTSTS